MHSFNKTTQKKEEKNVTLWKKVRCGTNTYGLVASELRNPETTFIKSANYNNSKSLPYFIFDSRPTNEFILIDICNKPQYLPKNLVENACKNKEMFELTLPEGEFTKITRKSTPIPGSSPASSQVASTVAATSMQTQPIRDPLQGLGPAPVSSAPATSQTPVVSPASSPAPGTALVATTPSSLKVSALPFQSNVPIFSNLMVGDKLFMHEKQKKERTPVTIWKKVNCGQGVNYQLVADDITQMPTPDYVTLKNYNNNTEPVYFIFNERPPPTPTNKFNIKKICKTPDYIHEKIIEMCAKEKQKIHVKTSQSTGPINWVPATPVSLSPKTVAASNLISPQVSSTATSPLTNTQTKAAANKVAANKATSSTPVPK